MEGLIHGGAYFRNFTVLHVPQFIERDRYNFMNKLEITGNIFLKLINNP